MKDKIPFGYSQFVASKSEPLVNQQGLRPDSNPFPFTFLQECDEIHDRDVYEAEKQRQETNAVCSSPGRHPIVNCEEYPH